MSDDVKLKPCPFCGSEPKTEEVMPRSRVGYWTVTCYGCDGHMTVVASGQQRRQAEDRWNRRAVAPSGQVDGGGNG